MTVQRLRHVGIVFDDLAAATAFFLELGLTLQGEGDVAGEWLDRVIGLEGIEMQFAVFETPDGNARFELAKFVSPPGPNGDRLARANAPGIRHLAFDVRDLDDVVARLQTLGAELIGDIVQYGDSFRLCSIRGPEGIIVELTEEIG
jgi:catechol 2,3-dioxygenase-like lactoylglutathione lyase family enzyme